MNIPFILIFSISLLNQGFDQFNQAQSGKPLSGTWVRHNTQGFAIIEIRDSNDITYYQMIDRKVYIDTITHDRYYFYKSAASMGMSDTAIWVQTDRFRFDYRLRNDSLIEFDNSGELGAFVRVHVE